MRKAYFAINYSRKAEFEKEVSALNRLFSKNNVELLVFVEKYNLKPNEEEVMMKTAFNEIDSSDILIAELSVKSIGVGIEIGYAYAKNIPIIYLHKEGTEYSTTAYGTATNSIKYKNIDDLISQMEILINQF